MAMTPAMVVVLTAPSPTRRTPSLPSAGAIFIACFTLEIYIKNEGAQSAQGARSAPRAPRARSMMWA